jgi:hypothetical protein
LALECGLAADPGRKMVQHGLHHCPRIGHCAYSPNSLKDGGHLIAERCGDKVPWRDCMAPQSVQTVGRWNSCPIL